MQHSAYTKVGDGLASLGLQGGDEVSLDSAGEQHCAYDQQPDEEQGTDDRVHDGCGVYPDELHSDSEDGGHGGDASQVSADFPLIPGRYYKSDSRDGEADLTG